MVRATSMNEQSKGETIEYVPLSELEEAQRKNWTSIKFPNVPAIGFHVQFQRLEDGEYQVPSLDPKLSGCIVAVAKFWVLSEGKPLRWFTVTQYESFERFMTLGSSFQEQTLKRLSRDAIQAGLKMVIDDAGVKVGPAFNMPNKEESNVLFDYVW